MRLVLTFLTCLIGASGALSAMEKVTAFTLDNGLEAVVIEDHRAPVAIHMLWYRAGAADEPPGASGIAHFLEHLLFKSTDNMASGEFSAVVARNGGTDNAFTGQDYTAYFQRIAADRLELMMKMESDRMVNLRLTPEDIETERNVVIEERNQRIENNPGALFHERRRAAQYLNHPYGSPIIGWRHEVSELGMEQALSFYRRYYAPNNAVLVVAGDVDPAEVQALAEKYYGVIPANPNLPERMRPMDPPHLAARQMQFRDARVSQPYFIRSYRAPERDSGDQEKAAALRMLATLLGEGQTSFLVRRLQFDEVIAVHASAYYGGNSLDDTLFGFEVYPAPGISRQEAEAALDNAVAEFLETGVDLEHLDRIKTQIRASQIYAQDSARGLAHKYGQALTQGLTLQDVQQWPGLLQAVTPEEIMQAAHDVLVPENSLSAWLLPEEDGQ